MTTVTNLAEIRKDRLHVLADMLAHAASRPNSLRERIDQAEPITAAERFVV
jgi:hypothetical protein